MTDTAMKVLLARYGMKIEDAEVITEDLNTMVEIARTNMTTCGWLGITHSAVALRNALEKQIPKEPEHLMLYDVHRCPVCEYTLRDEHIPLKNVLYKKHCPNGGQAIKWE